MCAQQSIIAYLCVQFNPTDVLTMRKPQVATPQAPKVSMEDMAHIYNLVVELNNPDKRESALLELRYDVCMHTICSGSILR